MRSDKILFKILIILLPIQLGRHFWPEWSYVLGLRIDYLSPTVYLTDLLVIIILGLWGVEKLKIQKLKFKITPKELKILFLPVALFLFLLVNCFLAQNQGVAFYKLFKIIEFTLLSFYVVRNHYPSSIINYPLFFAVIYSSLIALAQFIKQSSLNGLFWWLGERTFSAGTPGIAKAILGGRLLMRPYATFPHPNALAGFILVSLILTLPFLFQRKKLFAISCSLLAIGALILSFSRAVWLVGLGMGIWFLLRRFRLERKWASILLSTLLITCCLWLFFRLPFSTNEALSQRVQLIKTSASMIKKFPLIGIGLNNFVVRLPDFWQAPETIRLLQPVHNIFLLIAVETGLVGLAIFTWFLFLTLKKLIKKPFAINYSLLASLIAILLLGLFDHYWFTLQQTQLLLAIVLGLSWGFVLQ